MEPYSDDRLIAELRALRPTPRPKFAAELDASAAAGFPRGAGESVRTPVNWLAEWLRAQSPRRIALSLAGGAMAAILIATVVISQSDHSATHLTIDMQGAPPATSGQRATSAHGDKYGLAAPVPMAAGNQAEVGPETSGGSVRSGTAESSSVLPSVAPAAGNAGHRDVERSAEIGLVADPSDVDDDAAAVFRAVHRARGIVLRSTTTEGRHAGARFDLLIPAGELSDALEEISQIDRVRTRHEASADITAPTVSVAESLRDSRARIDSLLAELAGAESEAEREAVEAELRGERRHAAALASRLTGLHRRANFARVEVRIETGPSAAGGSGGWGAGDALHDAGRILAIAAGVTLIGLAVLAPLALVALLAWLAHRAWLRAARRRALG